MPEIAIRYRPIDAWPGPMTAERRPSAFSAPYRDTLQLLDRELAAIGAEEVVLQLALREDQIRVDGRPKANAATPAHPGVILAFDSPYGPLKYATDVFTRYEDNLRAIALGLESLRRVDRYGITKRGEQYSGWRQLGAGDGDADLLQRGRELIVEHGGATAALNATHPDHGGDREDFEAVQAVRRS